MEVTIENDHLIIKLPLERQVSGSGKSIVVASTHGNKNSRVQVEGRDVYVSVNAYFYPEDKKR